MTDYYRLEVSAALAELKTDPTSGLTAAEAANRLATYGKNALPKEGGPSLLRLFLNQFANIMVIILLVAAVISFFLGDIKDVIVILVIAILNAVLGTYQEYRAEQALAALSAMQVPQTRVRRDGEVKFISAEDLVPGDIVILQEGDSISADGRLIEAANLQIEESALTGESHPVEKNTAAVDKVNPGIGDRTNMVYMGTTVNYGRGVMVVTGTGLKTELGKIASMLMSVEETETPLQKRIRELGARLVYGAIIVVGAVFVVGLLRGIPIQTMLITAISLAVAAVPEGLPAVITIGLSLGAARMVERHALIRRLPAVETLGSVTVICSDKTGTLTKNEMTATLLALPGHEDVSVTGIGYKAEGEFRENDKTLDPRTDAAVARFLQALALATDAYLEQNGDQTAVVGDTTEGALLVAAQKVGWTRAQLERAMPRVAELPFSSERKAMTTIHAVNSADARTLFGDYPYIAITKGAPDRLIDWADYEHVPEGSRPLTAERRAKWQEKVDSMAARGLRVLGVAYLPLKDVPQEIKPEIERELYLLGLIGILDPSRPEARDAVAVAKSAGIRPIMITGDHALTAEAIARDLGILENGQRAITGATIDALPDDELAKQIKNTSAFARVSPEHKLRLVKILQGQHQVVAMTGDGVNDAPALKQADIGVAMGITGTDVSKGAADMVLTDDNFASIVAAVEEGRIIYDNIRKFVLYLLSSNVSEILVMFLALVAGLRVPLLAIHILWVNLVTDGLPAVALGFEPGEQGVMERKPRSPQESIFAGGMGVRIIWRALLLTALTLTAFLFGHSAHRMDPLSPTLGLERLNAAALTEVVGAEHVPSNWDALDDEERIELINGDEAAKTGEAEESESELLAQAERVPRTIAFTVLALGQIFHVVAIHAGEKTYLVNVWFSKNKFMLWAVLSTMVLQLAVIYVPFLQATFETAPLRLSELAGVFAIAALMLVAVELEKLVLALQARIDIAAQAA